MSRAVSTVVDTVLFLLLVSAAAVVVTGPGAETVDAPADETAELVTTSTTTVEYEFGEGPTVPRRAHGTYAGLLARAAVANATLDSRHIAPTGPAFAASVRERTAAVIGANVQLSACWTLSPRAPVAGQVTVGPDPPPWADVHVARFRVPVAVPATESRRTYSAIARAAAGAVTEGMLPGDSAELPLGEGPHRDSVSHRVDVLAGTAGELARRHAGAGDVTAATRVATEELAAVLATDLRRRFESPANATNAVRTGTATVVVRRWDR